jgi:hypothetical protein
MTKITLTLAAALLAGTTLTSAANAGGLRVGFGFPLGSFIAHSAQNSMDDGYSRRYERRRRVYEAERAPVRKAKPVSKVATAKPVAKPAPSHVITTAKLEDKLSSDPATTTEIAKTSDVTTASTTPASTPAPAATTNTMTAETAKVEKVATVDKTTTEAKSNTSETAPAKQICRRYSAAIAGLVDVPCNE